MAKENITPQQLRTCFGDANNITEQDSIIMATPTETVEGGTPQNQATLVATSKAAFSIENLGFMWAVLSFRAQAAIPAIPVGNIPLGIAALNIAITNMPLIQIGPWIFTNYVVAGSKQQINLPDAKLNALIINHTTPAHFVDAYKDIAALINVDQQLIKLCKSW